MTIQHLYPTTRPSLDLNFARTKRLDPRVTFTRGSTATYVGADGLIKTAASNEARFDHDPVTGKSLGLLVEEARTNNWNYSTFIDQSVWAKTNAIVIPNSLLAPDGTFTASKIVATSTAGGHAISRAQTNNVVSIASVFAKKGELGWIAINMYDTARGQSWQTNFDLTNGVIGNNANTFAKITSLSNGWYLCQAGRQANAGASTAIYVLQSNVSGFVYDGSQNNWTGNNSSGVYLWGLQVESNVSFPTSYIPTPATFTSRASTATYYDANGVIQTAGSGVARDNAYFPDSNGVMRPAGLLLEAAGTNLLTYSEQFDNAAWSRVTVNKEILAFGSGSVANATTAPDGTTTADLVVPNTTSALHYAAAQERNSAAGTYSFSCYVKPAGYSWILMQIGSSNNGAGVFFNAGSGQVGSSRTYGSGFSVASSSIAKVGNGWYRCTVVVTVNNVIGYAEVLFSNGDGLANATFAGNGTSGIYIWGAQLEASPYPTSYIPTAGSTVTRAADVSSSSTVTRSADVASMTGTNFSSWYNQNEGSFFLDERNSYGTSLALRFELNQNSSPNSNAIAFNVNYSTGTRISSRDSSTAGSVDITLSNVWASGGSHKYAYGLKLNNFSAVSGTNSATDTSGTFPPNLDSLSLGANARSATLSNSSGKVSIARLTYYPVRLPNATLQALTL